MPARMALAGLLTAAAWSARAGPCLRLFALPHEYCRSPCRHS
jgi:hypothetical protein